MLDLPRLLRIPSVDPDTDFHLHPCADKLAFAWNLSGHWEIYELSLTASATPQCLTMPPGGKFAPRYSPDGSSLAYVVDLDGSENYHLFLHSFLSRAPLDLTPGIEYALQPSFDWSPDGTQIALLSNRSGCFSTYLMEVASRRQRLLFENGCPVMEVRWSPRGDWLALCAETGGQDTGIFLVSTQDGEAFQLAENGRALNAQDPRWSPDGSCLAFCSDLEGFFNLGTYSLDEKRVTWLTQGSGDKEHPAWSPDGQSLVAVQRQGVETWLVLLEFGGDPSTRRVGHGLHSLPCFTSSGRSLVCVYDSPCQPPDLWLLPRQGGEPRQLTRSLPPDLPAEQFVMPEQLEYPGLDGVPVPALLYQASAVHTPAPTVVNIHGGPNWLYQLSWNPLMTHLASRGWLVLAPNYRGSTGFGRAWQLANRFDLGGVDTADVVAGARYLVSEKLADPRRMAVTGRSHGGYLTMTCLTQFPELWAGGSAVVPFLNWFTAHENSRSDLQHWDIENMGSPDEYHDLWYARSPFFFLDRVRAPVQLICGANDPRCPASESTAARDQLLALGCEVDFHLYPDEGHVFLNSENLVDAEQRRVEFLARLLA